MYPTSSPERVKMDRARATRCSPLGLQDVKYLTFTEWLAETPREPHPHP